MKILKYPITQVVYGYNSIEWLNNIKGKKIAIVTTRSLMRSKILSEILCIISAEVIEGPKQHTPEQDLIDLHEKTKNFEILVGLGGGSIIDGLKLATEESKSIIAIPTTLSGAEHTSIGGYTVEGLKKVKASREVNYIILDPKATLETPKWLLLSSAVRAIDHAIEAIYSLDSTSFTDALAIEGYKKLIKNLKKIDDIDSRLECQIGSWLASLTIRYVRMGISHAFGYIFGPRFGIPHGITSCISLPTSVKLNYNVAKNKLKLLEENEAPLYQFIDTFLKELNVRKRLSGFTTINEALKYSRLLVDIVNKSGNPIIIDNSIAEQYIRDLY